MKTASGRASSMIVAAGIAVLLFAGQAPPSAQNRSSPASGTPNDEARKVAGCSPIRIAVQAAAASP